MKNSETLLSAKYVAKHFGVCATTVRTWANKGWIKSYPTPGGHRRYRLSDLHDFVNRQGLTTAAPLIRSKKFLVINDEQDFLTFIQNFFAQYPSLRLESANNGFEAGNKIHHFKPDTILLNLNMASLNGFELCETLKQQTETKEIKVIAISSDNQNELNHKILSLGAEVILPKPLSEAVLANACQLSLTRSGTPYA